MAQSPVIKYAREIIDTLCAPGMHGRGYVNKGDSIAGNFIKTEFQRLSVNPLSHQYDQLFNFPVLTFPPPYKRDGWPIWLAYEHNSKRRTYLEPGKDFLIISTSSTNKTNYEAWWDVVYIKKTTDRKLAKFETTNLDKKIVVLDQHGLKKSPQLKIIQERITEHSVNAECIVILTDEKLTWDIWQKEGNIPIFMVKYSDSTKRLTKKSAIQYAYSSKVIPDYQSQNIAGLIRGTQYPDSFIVFSAHYDHLGRMGKDVYFPGANDNASGCAMLLSLAKYYSEHPPKYSIAFMAFGAEEVGLLGSKHYVENPLFPLKQIKFLVNMDIMGTGDEGIKVVNATEHKAEFDKLVSINKEKNYIPSVNPRGKAANSDHYFFEEAGVKTFFIYTLGGIKAYHDIYDRPETLPLTEFEDIYKLLIDFTEELQR